MKNYAKVGGKPGRPGYRTPSRFYARKKIEIQNVKADKIARKNAKTKG
jgi:hypothetical protein